MDRSEWIVVRNTHEGIVTQEEFDRANANMRSIVQGKKKNPANKGNFSVIVCPHCGLALRPGENADSFMYCPAGRMYRDSPCGSVRIRRDVAEQVLMELVRKQAELLVSAEQFLKEKRRQRAGKQGMVYYEEEYPDLLFAKDGEVFELDGKKAIVMGGAYSVDKMIRLMYGYGWWPDEQPSEEIKRAVERKLDELGWEGGCGAEPYHAAEI